MKTDTQLQQDVIAELGWEPSINAAHIGVDVRQGIVTLAGRVDEQSTLKLRASSSVVKSEIEAALKRRY